MDVLRAYMYTGVVIEIDPRYYPLGGFTNQHGDRNALLEMKAALESSPLVERVAVELTK